MCPVGGLDHIIRLLPQTRPLDVREKPDGQRVEIDDQGWGLTKDGRRDQRYKEPIGPPPP